MSIFFLLAAAESLCEIRKVSEALLIQIENGRYDATVLADPCHSNGKYFFLKKLPEE